MKRILLTLLTLLTSVSLALTAHADPFPITSRDKISSFITKWYRYWSQGKEEVQVSPIAIFHKSFQDEYYGLVHYDLAETSATFKNGHQVFWGLVYDPVTDKIWMIHKAEDFNNFVRTGNRIVSIPWMSCDSNSSWNL
jgi:hypothetical protein